MPRALASAIAKLLKDPERRERMGRAGLERVKRLFSAERMVEKTLGVYPELTPATDIRRFALDDTSHAAGTPNPPARG